MKKRTPFFETDKTKCFLIPLIFELHKDFKEKPTRGDDKYVSGGYVEKKLKFYHYVNQIDKPVELKPKQLSAFGDLLEFLKKKEVPVWLVQAPISIGDYESHTNNAEFDELMNQNGTYYNFNEMMSLSDTLHFYDGHHLNQNGVELFNQKLIEVLKEEGI